MKLVVLNSKIDNGHSIFQYFAQKDWAAFYVRDAQELWSFLELHGKSIDIAILKYEDLSQSLLEKIKAHPVHSDLPYIISYESITPAECAEHQRAVYGAHAYYEEPIEASRLNLMIGDVLNLSFVDSPAQNIKLEIPEATSEIKLDFDEPQKKDEDVPFFKESKRPDQHVKEESPPPIKSEKPLSSKKIDLESTRPSISQLDKEEALVEEFPYLFDRFKSSESASLDVESISAEEIIPGGFSENLDTATLKKYLELREKDVAILARENRTLKEEYQKIKESQGLEKIRLNEIEHTVKDQQRKIAELHSEKEILIRTHEAESSDLKLLQKEKVTKIKILEEMLSAQREEQNKLKDRVRSDIRKIRMREKELENRLEILKRDSEALLGAREGKILELKRKLDMTEFNLDLLQEQNSKEKEKISQLKEKLQRASQAMRLAGGFLGDDLLTEDGEPSPLNTGDGQKKIS